MSDALSTPSREELLTRAGFVRGLARVLTCDESRADDLFQDAYLTALRSPPRDSANVRGWLAAVLRNLVRMRLRAEGRRAVRERAAARPETAPSAAEVTARLEIQRRLVDAVCALEEPFRTAVVLRFFDGLRPVEIARRLDVPAKTVHSRLHRAMGKLRDRLDREHGGRRERWLAGLAPLAALPRRATAAAAGTAAVLGGALVMKKLVVGVAVVLVAVVSVAVWEGTRPTEPVREASPEPEVGDLTDSRGLPPGALDERAAGGGALPRRGSAGEREEAATPWRLVVRAVGPDGAPAEGANVVFEAGRGKKVLGRTGADGGCELEVRGGGTLVVVRPADGDLAEGSYVPDIEPPESGEAEYYLRLQSPDAFGPTLDGARLGERVGGARGPFGGRGGHRNVKAMGGGARSESATDLGLEWLKDHQSEGGGWDADGFMFRCRLNHCGGPGHPEADVAVTSLALLAFLGGGETHRHGRYKKTVRRGLDFLVTLQTGDGAIGTGGELGIASHALATQALAEAFSLTGSRKLEEAAAAALAHLARSPPAPEEGASARLWVLSALVSARLADLEVDPALFDDAEEWLAARLEDGLLRPGDSPAPFPPDSVEALTAAEVFLRAAYKTEVGTWYRSGLALLSRSPPDRGGDFLYRYFGGLAMFQAAGQAWKDWNEGLKSQVVPSQRKDGDEKGSWDPIGREGQVLGRVGTTALQVLCAEIYYRYSRPLKVTTR